MAPKPSSGARGRVDGEAGNHARRKRAREEDFEDMEFVAPDGGWGWVVAAASGLSSFSTLPLGQNFGLIYKEKYEEWGITQAEYSFMRNLEFSVSSAMGLLAGALLRRYGYRKISLLGGCLGSLSYIITSQISSFTFFIIFFSILGGIGMGISWPSTALALNTYFKKRRGIATGLSWTATGLSPVLMPQLISVLMDYTDVHGTVLILAGITLHTIPMALLLQPAHWHGRWVPKVNRDVKRPPVAEEQKTFLQVSPEGDSLRSPERKASLRRGQVEVFDEGGDCIVDTQSTLGLDVAAPISRQASVWSLSSSRGRLDNRLCEECQKVCEGVGAAAIATPVADDDRNKSTAEARGVATGVTTKRPKWWKRMAGAIVDFFDLTLLQDPKFVVIFVGMTLGFVAEVNFALLVPFIYSEFGYSRDRVALFMSTLATVDLLTRFTVPFITDRFKMDPKVMYGLGLMILSTGRIGLAHLDGFNTIMAVTVWLGFGKGLRTVFMALVIPSYVPLHRLPSASGLQMMSNGIIFICVGPLFGHLRDSSTSYATALHCLNLLTFGMVTLWTVDYLVERTCRRNNKKKFSEVVI